MRGKGVRTWKNNNEAVSEVVGSALLVGLTVAVVSAFGLVATQAFSPVEKVNAELSPQLKPGPDGVWGGGAGVAADDRLEIVHLGGADLPGDGVKITITTPAGAQTFERAALGPIFDGGFVIGETWVHVGRFQTCDPIQFSFVIDHGRGGSQLLMQETLVADEGVCA